MHIGGAVTRPSPPNIRFVQGGVGKRRNLTYESFRGQNKVVPTGLVGMLPTDKP